MLGKTAANSVYALYRRNGSTEWDYIIVSRNEWDEFCQEKEASVDSDRMHKFLELQLRKEQADEISRLQN